MRVGDLVVHRIPYFREKHGVGVVLWEVEDWTSSTDRSYEILWHSGKKRVTYETVLEVIQ